MLKRFKLLSIVLMVAFLLTACGAKDLTQGKTPREIIELSYEKQQSMENFEMDFIMDMTMPLPGMEPMAITMNGQASVFQKPLLMKMVMEMDNPETGEPLMMEQYMEGTDTGFIMYQHLEDIWYKMTFDDPSFAELMNMDPAKNTELFLKYLTEAKAIGDEKVGALDTVKIELIASSEMYHELMGQLPNSGFGPMDMPFDGGILSQMGDLKYTAWVDKASLDMVKMSMDLSENMRNLANALKEDGSLPAEALMMFDGLEMSMVYEIKNINKAAAVTIPEEAMNAEELSLP